MLLYRTDEGWAVDSGDGDRRRLLGGPFDAPPRSWATGESVEATALQAPVAPTKIVGIGRSYREHARELDNPVPKEPLLFLKAPSSIIGPGDAVVLPPESARVEFEGEIGVVIGRRLSRPTREEAAAGILGVTCACDVTARDLQRSDATFARGKSFDTFCPLGPAVRIGAELEEITVVTRLNGEERQRGCSHDMIWPIVDLVTYASRMMTLMPGDLVLTGTPAGVGALAPGDRLEVEVDGVGVLSNPVLAR